jgi:hypothetical protein
VVRVVAVAAVLALGGCGFIGTGRTADTKPDEFTLRGYVSVGGAAAGAPRSPCQSRVPDIAAGGPVRVADPDGRTLAAGQLGGGVLAADVPGYRCNFPFEIPGVPGGADRYVIGVGARPAATFAAQDLRRDGLAVIRID